MGIRDQSTDSELQYIMKRARGSHSVLLSFKTLPAQIRAPLTVTIYMTRARAFPYQPIRRITSFTHTITRLFDDFKGNDAFN